MKAKSKEFINVLLTNPKISNTEAYMRTHGTTNRKSASVSASKLLAKPSASIYIAKHVEMATNRISTLVNNAKKEETQLRAAQDILDRTYGKPSQAISSVNYSFVEHVNKKAKSYGID
ncbi:MAG: hypothetical protein U0451_00060 [Candidatus Saccharimonadales bacterium]